MMDAAAFDQFMSEDDELRKLEQEALKKYGRSLEELTEEEKNTLYRAYQAERELLNAEYARGAAMEGGTAEGRMAGNIYQAANPLEHLNTVARTAVGAGARRQATEGLEGLAKDEAMGRRVGGEVAANQQQRGMDTMLAMAKALRGGATGQPTPPPTQPTGAAAGAPTGAPVQPQQPQQPQAMPGQGATPALRPPMAGAINPMGVSPEEMLRRKRLQEMLRGGGYQ